MKFYRTKSNFIQKQQLSKIHNIGRKACKRVFLIDTRIIISIYVEMIKKIK